ncbi:hypothetical protein Ancab_013464 [Ancistrocladus abbreviatus]
MVRAEATGGKKKLEVIVSFSWVSYSKRHVLNCNGNAHISLARPSEPPRNSILSLLGPSPSELPLGNTLSLSIHLHLQSNQQFETQLRCGGRERTSGICEVCSIRALWILNNQDVVVFSRRFPVVERRWRTACKVENGSSKGEREEDKPKPAVLAFPSY